jgi:hypothetical protein
MKSKKYLYIFFKCILLPLGDSSATDQVFIIAINKDFTSQIINFRVILFEVEHLAIILRKIRGKLRFL